MSERAPGSGGVAPVSATEPDWSREAIRAGEWDPGKRLLRSVRRYQAWKARGGLLGRLMSKWWVLQWRWWTIATGAEIPLQARIGGGLAIPHPNGVVIHPAAEIGVNCLLMQQVTIGASKAYPDRNDIPRLEGHVDVGAGAKILGGVTIGAHARIGANAVVLQDVPAGATAVGIPARVILPRSGAGGLAAGGPA